MVSRSSQPAGGQAAGEEEDRRGGFFGEGGEQAGGAGGEQREHRDAGEDDLRDRAAVAPGPGEDEDERRGEQAEEEGADRQQRDLLGEEDDDQDRPEAGAAGDADHVGRGQRVGEGALEDRPGDAERGADDQRFDRPREPQGLDDLVVRPRLAAAEEDVEDFPRRHLDRAQRELGDRGGDQQGDEGRQDDQAPRQGSAGPVVQVLLADFLDRLGDVGPGLQERVVGGDVDLAFLRGGGRAPGRVVLEVPRRSPGCRRGRRAGRRSGFRGLRRSPLRRRSAGSRSPR